jgi:ATP-binding cassette subfamily C protein/ATP-binding cassette subfamily C protein LapB
MTVQLKARPVREQLPQSLQQVLSSGSFVAFELVSETAACLRPLLEALEWRGDARDFAEALPHHVDDLTITDLRNTLAHLGYASRPLHTSMLGIDSRHTPCLFVPRAGAPVVVVRIEGENALIFDSAVRKTHHVACGTNAGTAYVFSRDPDAAAAGAAAARRGSWIARLLGRFADHWRTLIAVSVASNLLALSVPLFTLALYDSIIPSGSLSTLAMLSIGMAVLLAFELGVLYLRGNLLAFVGARIDFLISSTVFKRLLDLPPNQVEQAPLGAQIGRLRDLHAVRSIFTGPVCVAMLDLPFVLLFLATILLVSHWLVLVPVCAAVLYILAAFGLHRRFKRHLQSAAQATTEYQSFLIEMASKVRAIKTAGLQDIWLQRHRQLSGRSSVDAYALTRLAHVTDAFAEGVKLAAGVLTLMFGIIAVMANALTVGALIATMALVWRCLSPFQVLFLAAIRLEQARNSIRAIDGLMMRDTERAGGVARASRKTFAGRVTFGHVSFRYRPDRDPAVFGLNFEVKPGEMIALTGPSGCGKSTVLKLILGLHTPQLGAIQIDGLDLRQLDPVQLRQDIAYLGHISHFFHGTVAQNLRLAAPVATDQELTEAALEARVLDEVLALPEGFDTWLDSERMKNLSEGMRQRLALARLYVRRSPILLLDEPGQGLDEVGNHALLEALHRRKGRCTIFIATHQPDHMRFANRVFVLERGLIRASGPPATMVPKLVGTPR